jgi:hypothetical protein
MENAEPLKKEYKTPRICVRGVFLCEDVAVPASVWTWEIPQAEWGPVVILGDVDAEGGDLWVGY